MSVRDKLTPKTKLSSRIELKSKEKLELKPPGTRTKSELSNKHSSAGKSPSGTLPVNEKISEHLVSDKASNVSLSNDTVEATAVSKLSSDMSLASDTAGKRVSDKQQGEPTAIVPLPEGMTKPDLLKGQ